MGGPAKQPSRDLIIRLGWTLELTLQELDELLMVAGYAPLRVDRRVDSATQST
jgi:hypothetical protein